jgi:hypothetical protein
VKARVGCFASRIDAEQESLEAKRGAIQEKTEAWLEELMGDWKKKMACQEETKAYLERREANSGTTEALLVATEALLERQNVHNEVAMVQTDGKREAVGSLNPLQRRIMDSVVQETPKRRSFRKT